jgi:hypothetical protein
MAPHAPCHHRRDGSPFAHRHHRRDAGDHRFLPHHETLRTSLVYLPRAAPRCRRNHHG